VAGLGPAAACGGVGLRDRRDRRARDLGGEAPGAPAAPEPASDLPVPWLLSAADETALRAQAGRLAADLSTRPGLASADIGYTLAVSRGSLPHRALVPSGDRARALEALEALATGLNPAGVVRGLAVPKVRTAFADDGVSACLEVGPGPALTAAAAECLTEAGTGGPVLAAAGRGGAPEPQTLLSALARLHMAGTDVDWATVFARSGARRVDLPTYAFQRRRYWLDAASPAIGDQALLGPGFPVPGTERTVLSGQLSLATHPWLADHVVAGRVIVSATVFVEMAVRAGDEVGCGAVDDLVLLSPLALPRSAGVRVQVVVSGRDDSGRRPVDIYSRPEESAEDVPWTRHVSGQLGTGPAPRADRAAAGAPVPWPPPGAEAVDLTGAYAALADAGLAYGPAFQGVGGLWHRGDDIFVAHLVAHHLEGMGRAPVGLVLLDTYHITPDNHGEDWLLSLAAPPPQDPGRPLFSGDDDSALAAMGAYNRIFLGWHPEPVTAPTLLVRASHPTSAMAASADGCGWRTSWPSAHDVLDVPGDHLTMMQEHADTTASAVRTWIERASADPARARRAGRPDTAEQQDCP
jgi:acyl transferase domain-containing protein